MPPRYLRLQPWATMPSWKSMFSKTGFTLHEFAISMKLLDHLPNMENLLKEVLIDMIKDQN
jgi:hypothetical protein